MKAAQITGEVAMYRTAQKHQAQADKEKAIGYRQVDQNASSRRSEASRNAGRLAEKPEGRQTETETDRDRQKRRPTGREASRQTKNNKITN